MAYREVYPKGEIPNFTGGKSSTVPFFTNRNFEICRISKGTYIPEEVEDVNLKEQMNLIDDADLKDSYDTPIERLAAKTETHRQSYERNPKISKIALKKSGYKCEINPKHITFYRKSDGKPYVEPHHIIPMAKQDDFNYSLDIPQNIVSLCSNCHNEVHCFASDVDRRMIRLQETCSRLCSVVKILNRKYARLQLKIIPF